MSYRRNESAWFRVAQAVIPLGAAVFGITCTAIGVYRMSQDPVTKPAKHNPDKEEFQRATQAVIDEAQKRRALQNKDKPDA